MGSFENGLEGDPALNEPPSIGQQGHDLWILGRPRASCLNLREDFSCLLPHSGMDVVEG